MDENVEVLVEEILSIQRYLHSEGVLLPSTEKRHANIGGVAALSPGFIQRAFELSLKGVV